MKKENKKNSKETKEWGPPSESDQSKKQAAEAPSREDWEGGGSRPEQEKSA